MTRGKLALTIIYFIFLFNSIMYSIKVGFPLGPPPFNKILDCNSFMLGWSFVTSMTTVLTLIITLYFIVLYIVENWKTPIKK